MTQSEDVYRLPVSSALAFPATGALTIRANMKCLYGTWHDWTNRPPLNRAAVMAYAFFYEKVVDDSGMLGALERISKFGRYFSEHGSVPEPRTDDIVDIAFPRMALDYFLHEIVRCARPDYSTEVAHFLRSIDAQGRYFYESKFYEQEAWEEPTSARPTASKLASVQSAVGQRRILLVKDGIEQILIPRLILTKLQRLFGDLYMSQGAQ